MHPPPQLEKSWAEALHDEWEKPYMRDLVDFLSKERAESTPIYPPQSDVFNAFSYAPFSHVNVVIMGQDPYHGPHQAQGLSFSVREGIRLPPSLKNIFKELMDDLGLSPPKQGSLEKWAKQGVLMLNATLTVRAGQPRSHHGQGWEYFTDAVLERLNRREDPVIFVLWGKAAQEKCTFIQEPHYVLTAAHPSPYSAYNGFFGCKHFSKINELLKKQKKNPINWMLK